MLKDDYPRLEPYHRMSDAEAQEKMMLWKLRSSVSRQMPSARGTDKAIVTMEQGSLQVSQDRKDCEHPHSSRTVTLVKPWMNEQYQPINPPIPIATHRDLNNYEAGIKRKFLPF